MDSSDAVILVFIILGGVFCVIAIFMALRSERLEKRGRLTTGVITELVKEQSRDADGFLQIYYHPVFRFDDPNGTAYLVKSSVGTNPTGFRVGQTVRILYDPEKPYLASIDTFSQMWMSPLVFGIVGPIMLTVAAIMWWKQSH
jgi:hypothetical protein